MFFRRKDKMQRMARDDLEQGNNIAVPHVLIFDYLREQRRKRRWGLFFKLLMLSYIGFALYLSSAENPLLDKTSSHTAVVEINGLISSRTVNAIDVNESLQAAFSNPSAKGVIVQINSGGGTPVQAAQINEEIIRLKERYSDKPVYATIDDIGASGAYYVAVATDKIYAHPASIIGSIGVIIQSFGFNQGIEKLGIERRVVTAGENKNFFDPFVAENPEEIAHTQTMLDEVHQQFISAVKQGRGDRLQSNADIFSGLFWNGETAKKLGLIDEFGNTKEVARDVIGEEKIINYTKTAPFYQKLFDQVAVAVSNAVFNATSNIQLQ